MKNLKVVLYWLSVIPPVIDAIKGLVTGIKKGLEDVRTAAAAEEAMREKFDKANRGD